VPKSRDFRLQLAAICVAILSSCVVAAEPQIVHLWAENELTKIPQPETIVERSKDPAKPDRSIRAVSDPTVTIYLPDNATGPTAAVVICPGGGYGGLAIDKEGHDVARWLNSIGVAGIVLKYRLPRVDISKDQTPWPMQDAWRAMRLVRSHAADWKIDAARVGIMGFSAGGHLAAMTATHFDAGKAETTDPIGRFSSRPDFVILLYPVISLHPPIGHGGSRANLLGKTPDEKLVDYYSADLQVTPQTSSAFVVQTRDDPVKVGNSIQFDAAMQKAKAPCELHLFATGGHGYGLGVHGGEVATWPKLCEEWMKRTGILKAKSSS
jgi:acetyl esterase/lipase